MNTSPKNGIYGGWLVLLGVFIISPDSLLLRLVQTNDMTTLFGRLGCLAIALLIAFVGRNIYQGKSVCFAMKPSHVELIAGIFYAFSSLFFSLSIQNTEVSNTLVIIAATPLISGLVGLLVFKHKLPLRTWTASIVVVVALCLIFSGGLANNNIVGDFFALGTAFSMACYFNMLSFYKDIDSLRIMMIGAVLSALAVTPFSHPLTISAWDWLWFGLMGGVVLPFSFFFISKGAKKIAAPEVGLIMLNEAIIGSTLVWFFIGEVPRLATVLSGVVVLATLTVHSLLAMRDKDKQAF